MARRRGFVLASGMGALLAIAAGAQAVPALGLGALSAPSVTTQTGGPPAPQKLAPTGDPALDNIFYGAIPANGEAKPVLLFVHGLAGVAQDWWADSTSLGLKNDMYALAHQHGYRTAFVTLNPHGERSPGNDLWVNGQTLSKQISAVTRHFGVPRVDIVAHSKGGVDTQAAIVHNGAAEQVRNVFTLGSPHWGSEIANLATDSPIVTQLLSQFDYTPGPDLLTLQTTTMSEFRAKTDPMAATQAVRYYSAAGMDWGQADVVFRMSGRYLYGKGPNDGLVTVSSTKLPGSTTLFIQPYHHFSIFIGRNAFPWIRAVLERSGSA